MVKESITCNSDITELVEFASTSSYSGGQLSVIKQMKNGDSIATFRPLVCSICRKPMKGALIEPESEIGRKLFQLIGTGAVHDNCNMGFPSKAGY
jgi:hypothetical protein